jgi:hypothetical protein
MRNFHALTRAPQAFLAGPLPSQTCLSGPNFGQKLSQSPLPKSGATYQLAGYGRGAWDALHNSTRAGAARIGMGCKAHFAANSACYWQERQRRRPPEAGLAQAVRGYAEHPLVSIEAWRWQRGPNGGCGASICNGSAPIVAYSELWNTPNFRSYFSEKNHAGMAPGPAFSISGN